MPILNDADNVTLGGNPVDRVYLETVIVWQAQPDPVSKPTVTNIKTDGTLTVSWGVSLEAVKYEVYRDGVLIGTTPTRSFEDSGLDWETTYTYTVIPYNDNDVPGDESEPSDPVFIEAPTMGPLTASNRSYTNVTVSWTKILGATNYLIVVNGDDSRGVLDVSSADVPTSTNTTKTIAVIPVRAGKRGKDSGTYTYYSGSPEQRDVGSKDHIWIYPAVKMDSWRSVDNWDYLSNTLAQGTYGTYGSYTGVSYYGPVGIRDALRSALGNAARQQNGYCTAFHFWLQKKTGVGSSGPVTVGFYMSNSPASGGQPSIEHGRTRTSTDSGVGAWYEIGSDFGNWLGSGTYTSIAINYNGTDNYAQFTGGQTGYISLNWTWNYVAAPAKPNVWTTP